MSAYDHSCPTCGAAIGAPCRTFDVLRDSETGATYQGPSYVCEPHVFRECAETYRRAVSIRFALLGGQT